MARALSYGFGEVLTKQQYFIGFAMDYWFLFPTGLAISILAMSSGISGSNFWIPIYILALGVEPIIGFWLALFTMLFGFGSGVSCNLYRRNINFSVAGKYLIVVLPGATLGGYFSGQVPQGILLLLFAILIFAYSVHLLLQISRREPEEAQTHDKIYWLIGALAGFSKGLIATGLGKFILPFYLHHKEIKNASQAVGTTVAIVFIANLAAIAARMNPEFIGVLEGQKEYLYGILVWVVPSVVIGGFIAPFFTERISKTHLQGYVAILLIVVSLVTLLRIFLSPELNPFY